MRAAFWWTWPSWLVEALSGISLQLFLHLYGSHPFWITLPVGAAMSLLYERAFDRNGWNRKDVQQRAYGQIGLEVLWALL